LVDASKEENRPIAFIPTCVQRCNLKPEAGQAGRYGKALFQIDTTERNLVL
jgi:hypothetical protein